jgi:hypothetical protein
MNGQGRRWSPAWRRYSGSRRCDSSTAPRRSASLACQESPITLAEVKEVHDIVQDSLDATFFGPHCELAQTPSSDTCSLCRGSATPVEAGYPRGRRLVCPRGGVRPEGARTTGALPTKRVAAG